jgi:hypothetical protein
LTPWKRGEAERLHAKLTSFVSLDRTARGRYVRSEYRYPPRNVLWQGHALRLPLGFVCEDGGHHFLRTLCKALQDAVLSVHHATMHTFNGAAVKIIENHLGVAYVKIAQTIQVPIGFPQGVGPGAIVPSVATPPGGSTPA